MAVYPDGWALLASNSLETPVLGLVGRADGLRFDLDEVAARLRRNRFPSALARFAGDAPPNTDDRPIVAYRAPRITYAPDSSPSDRLSALLQALRIAPDELVADGTDPTWMRRLADYARARDRFIEAGRGVRPSADVQAMLAQVRAPLLAVLRTSPDFRPAYDPLLRMALMLRRSDPGAADTLLGELADVKAEVPVAASSRIVRGTAQTAPQGARRASEDE